MKINNKSIYAIMFGLAVAGLSALIYLADERNNRKNGVLTKLSKVKHSIKNNRITKTGNRKDIPDCFI